MNGLVVENCFLKLVPSQNTNVYHMVVQCSQMFANIKHCITVFNEHLFDVCEDSSKCEKRFCLAGTRLATPCNPNCPQGQMKEIIY